MPTLDKSQAELASLVTTMRYASYIALNSFGELTDSSVRNRAPNLELSLSGHKFGRELDRNLSQIECRHQKPMAHPRASFRSENCECFLSSPRHYRVPRRRASSHENRTTVQ